MHKFLNDEKDGINDCKLTYLYLVTCYYLSNRKVVLQDVISPDDNFCNQSENNIRCSPSNCLLSGEFSYKINYQVFKSDELDQYLEVEIPSSIVNDNPLHFWPSDSASKYASLKRLARTLFSIPTTSSGTK